MQGKHKRRRRSRRKLPKTRVKRVADEVTKNKNYLILRAWCLRRQHTTQFNIILNKYTFRFSISFYFIVEFSLLCVDGCVCMCVLADVVIATCISVFKKKKKQIIVVGKQRQRQCVCAACM